MNIIKEADNTSLYYSLDEVCPICGAYMPDGGVCFNCLKAHDLYEPKTTYSEE